MHVLEAPDRRPSPTSASPAPTGQADIAGSAENNHCNYRICMWRSKTPESAEEMHKSLKPAARADNTDMTNWSSSESLV